MNTEAIEEKNPPVNAIPLVVQNLYRLVNELERAFPGRRFSLDGHLVGSIGEVLASHFYNLQLLASSSERHDAVARDGRNVQIKATQCDRVALRSQPECLLVLKLSRDGSFEEIYNGPGDVPWSLCGRRSSNGQRQISLSTLRRLMHNVPAPLRLRRGA
jgi:hypothetical protein